MIPIFLFSLPRSGSTLAQRILGTHVDISTVSECWILLPHLYALKREGCYTDYGHQFAVDALQDFCDALPQGKEDYLLDLKEFVLGLYKKAAQRNTKYFLDKTPRYHLVAEDIIQMFPEAKSIFLWRNPLAVVASIIDTWDAGAWNLYRYKVDLFDGLSNLISVYEKHAAKFHTVRYEDLITNDEPELRKIFDYLGLSFDPILHTHFNQIRLEGRAGDPTGMYRYQTISKEPLTKWQYILCNPLRKRWCRRYLQWIGRERLQVMGYELDQLLSDLEAAPTTFTQIGSDVARMSFGIAHCLFEPRIMQHKIRALPHWHRLHAHT